MTELTHIWRRVNAWLRGGPLPVNISARGMAGLGLAAIIGASILVSVGFGSLRPPLQRGSGVIDARLCEELLQASVRAVHNGKAPNDFTKVEDIGCRKRIFVQIVLSLVRAENAEISRERERLIGLSAVGDSGASLTWSQRRFLDHLAERYQGRARNPAALLDRVDEVPASLAVAQAAVESAWGSSRFFHEGNALYGQQTYNVDDGIMPAERPEGARYLVRHFKTLRASVRAYIENLNTHPAYRDFRVLRAQMRRAGMPLEGQRLVGTLLSYSERGEDYIASLRTIMRVNGLGAYDTASLSPVDGRP